MYSRWFSSSDLLYILNAHQARRRLTVVSDNCLIEGFANPIADAASEKGSSSPLGEKRTGYANANMGEVPCLVGDREACYGDTSHDDDAVAGDDDDESIPWIVSRHVSPLSEKKYRSIELVLAGFSHQSRCRCKMNCLSFFSV